MVALRKGSFGPRGRAWLVSASVILLASCGGGGGGTPAPTPTPTPANQAPAFTSAAAATVSENVVGSFYQAAATDPEGRPLTFSIAGGADAARFTITPGGQLSFATPPNFEAPADADGNNVYQVQIAVSDGQTSAVLALSITVTNTSEGIVVRRVASGFVRPVAISPVSASVVLVAEERGAVYSLDPQSGTRTLLAQIPNLTDKGMLAIAAAPDFATTGAFFVMYRTANGFLVLNRYLRNPAGPTVPDNSGPIFAVPYAQEASGGWLGLDTDGTLLAATPAAPGSGDPTGSAQADNSRLGKVIRIRPNPDPFAGASAVYFLLSEVAKGFHQPTGGVVYPGGLLLADSGEEAMEEIDLLSPINGASRNFGWPFKEGTRALRGTPPAGLVDPVIEYVRAQGQSVGDRIVGGAIGGNAIASLNGHFVFADRGGAVFSIPAASLQIGTTRGLSALERRDADFRPDNGLIERPVSVQGDAAGTIYILDSDGEVFRVDAG